MQYVHGGDVYRHPVKYDFSVNTNPLGMPEAALQAAKEGLLLAGTHYPDWRGEALRRELSVRTGIPAQQIILGNGAAELIYSICQYLRPKKGLVMAPAFQEYEAALRSAGAECRIWELPEERDFALEKTFVDFIQGEEDILFLCNPNNPTAGVIDRELLLKIAEKCEKMKTYLCVDECFLPFLPPQEQERKSIIPLWKEYPHLIVLCAFTKIYGMPGLRLGYACFGDEKMAAGIRSVLQPWNTSIPAQLAGLAALQEDAYLEQTYALLEKERDYLQKELRNGLVEKLFPSLVNFFFFRGQKELQKKLLRKGILIRSCENYRNLPEGYYRIAVKTHEENQELIRAMQALGDDKVGQ